LAFTFNGHRAKTSTQLLLTDDHIKQLQQNAAVTNQLVFTTLTYKQLVDSFHAKTLFQARISDHITS